MIRLDEFANNQQSVYLNSEFSDEFIWLKDITLKFEGTKISANAAFTVSNYKADRLSYRWHLSDITSYRAVGQLAIGTLCQYYERTKEELGELWQQSYSVRNRKPVTNRYDIALQISMELVGSRGKRKYYDASFDVAEKSFIGTVRCCLDIT